MTVLDAYLHEDFAACGLDRRQDCGWWLRLRPPSHVGGVLEAMVLLPLLEVTARHGTFQADATQQPRTMRHILTQITRLEIKAAMHVRPSVMS